MKLLPARTFCSGKQIHITGGVTTRASAGAAVQTLLSGASYEAFGALAGASLGNGLTLEQGWSADGRLTARRLRQGAVLRHGLAYSYDLDDEFSAITAPHRGSAGRVPLP